MAIYYVDPLNGADVGNDGLSPGAAFLTTQKAADTANVAGDEVRLMNTGVELITAQIDFDLNTGTAAANIRFVSYNAMGTTPEDGYTIRANAAMTAVLSINGLIDFLRFAGITIDGNGQATYGVFNTSDHTIGCTFNRCRITGATGDGANFRSNSVPWTFIKCDIDNNGGEGIEGFSNGRGAFQLLGCRIFDNTGGGVIARIANCTMIGCEVFRNGTNGLYVGGTSADYLRVINCTFYDNGDDGIDLNFSGATQHTIINTTMVNNAGYGLKIGTVHTNDEQFIFYGNNHTHGNTSGATDFAVPEDRPNVTGDPLFTDAANGNFTPLTGSPLIDAGINNLVIGAKGNLDAGGTVVGGSGMSGGWTG